MNVLEIAEKNDEELQSWVHGELSEENRRRGEGEADLNFRDLELLDVDLLHVSLRFIVWLALKLFECALDLLDLIS